MAEQEAERSRIAAEEEEARRMLDLLADARAQFHPPDVVLDHATTLPLPPPIDAAPLPQMVPLPLLVSAPTVLPESASASSGQPASSLTVVQPFINAAMENGTAYRNLIFNLHQQGIRDVPDFAAAMTEFFHSDNLAADTPARLQAAMGAVVERVAASGVRLTVANQMTRGEIVVYDSMWSLGLRIIDRAS